MIRAWKKSFYDLALDGDDAAFGGFVGEDLDGFEEGAFLAFGVVGDGDLAAGSGGDGAFGVGGEGAVAGGFDLEDDEGFVAGVFEGKGVGDGFAFRADLAEVVLQVGELHGGLGRSEKAENRKQKTEKQLFHG